MTMRIPPECLGHVKKALERYTETVEATDLALTSKNTYTLHARYFGRWLRGNFEPGSQLPRFR